MTMISRLNDMMNEIYRFNLVFWELCFVCSGCNSFLLLLQQDISQAMAYIPVLISVCFFYFLCSYASAATKEGFDNVGQSLYTSQWYLLSPSHRKDFLMILMMANKEKTFTVGSFGYSSLERFSNVNFFETWFHLL